MRAQPPWASGPGEILRHGLDLLREDTDTKRRLAMISIDNSVELMMKVYLGLPERVTGLKIPRKEYQEFSESFPALLNALERYAADTVAPYPEAQRPTSSSGHPVHCWLRLVIAKVAKPRAIEPSPGEYAHCSVA
jgi:hypothetical protein